MGYRRIITRARDEAGNVHGADAIQVTAVEAGATAAVTAYLDSAGATTVANPHRAFPGTETRTNAAAVSGDDTVQVESTTGFTVGDFISIDGSGGKIRRAVKAILAGPARLQFEKTLGVAMNSGATVGGKKDKGLWAAYVVDDRDYETTGENTGTGQVLQGPFFPYLSPSASPTMPNLVPNSDFARRTKWMTFMPEVFADVNGWTAVTGSLGSVASNLLTAGTAGAAWQVRAGLSTWRDVRASAQLKLTTDADVAHAGVLVRFVDASNYVFASIAGGATDTLRLRKVVAGAPTTVAEVAIASPTLNNFYWVEVEAQGTTFIAKAYSSGAAAVAKSSATLLATASGAIADAALAAGYAGLGHDAAFTTASAWGGLATGDGGVYVEGWGPESWTTAFTDTKGGQAIGFDEAADSGPLEKQWAMTAYIPATSRSLTLDNDGPDGGLRASTIYSASYYVKNTGLGGSGVMCRLAVIEKNSAGAAQQTTNVDDAAETTWTQKTNSSTLTTHANARKFTAQFHINPADTRTGTVRFSLPQLEQSQVATQWRNAPEDFAPLVWHLPYTAGNPVMSSLGEVDSSRLGINAFIPWDATVRCGFHIDGSLGNTGSSRARMRIDGADISPWTYQTRHDSAAGIQHQMTADIPVKLAAGKHRFALLAEQVTASSFQVLGQAGVTFMNLIATKGK